MDISYLADRPEFIPALARGTREEYALRWPDRTVAWRLERYRGHCNRRDLPIAWVAHDGDEPLGTAALRLHDVDDREELTPWLGGVFVFPAHRGRGVGAALCATVEGAAGAGGAGTLYLGTFDNRDWYRRLGWQGLGPGTVHGQRCEIMMKALTDTTAKDSAP